MRSRLRAALSLLAVLAVFSLSAFLRLRLLRDRGALELQPDSGALPAATEGARSQVVLTSAALGILRPVMIDLTTPDQARNIPAISF